MDQRHSAVAEGPPGRVRTRTPYARFVKPFLDRLFGLVLAIITLPVLTGLLLAAWIAFGWPPLYRAAHVGKNDSRFNLYRIRSRFDYETDVRGRRRRFGQWLRRTRVEDLPQLWNVVFGQMSLVGPAPLHPLDAIDLREDGELRTLVKPGLFGSWEMGPISTEPDLSDAVEVDVAYEDELSLATDARILFRTAVDVIRPGK